MPKARVVSRFAYMALCRLAITSALACHKSSNGVIPRPGLKPGEAATAKVGLESASVLPSIGLDDPFEGLPDALLDEIPNLQTSGGFTLVPFDTHNSYDAHLNT